MNSNPKKSNSKTPKPVQKSTKPNVSSPVVSVKEVIHKSTELVAIFTVFLQQVGTKSDSKQLRDSLLVIAVLIEQRIGELKTILCGKLQSLCSNCRSIVLGQQQLTQVQTILDNIQVVKAGCKYIVGNLDRGIAMFTEFPCDLLCDNFDRSVPGLEEIYPQESVFIKTKDFYRSLTLFTENSEIKSQQQLSNNNCKYGSTKLSKNTEISTLTRCINSINDCILQLKGAQETAQWKPGHPPFVINMVRIPSLESILTNQDEDDNSESSNEAPVLKWNVTFRFKNISKRCIRIFVGGTVTVVVVVTVVLLSVLLTKH